MITLTQNSAWYDVLIMRSLSSSYLHCCSPILSQLNIPSNHTSVYQFMAKAAPAFPTPAVHLPSIQLTFGHLIQCNINEIIQLTTTCYTLRLHKAAMETPWFQYRMLP